MARKAKEAVLEPHEESMTDDGHLSGVESTDRKDPDVAGQAAQVQEAGAAGGGTDDQGPSDSGSERPQEDRQGEVGPGRRFGLADMRQINASIERVRRRALDALERQRSDVFSVPVQIVIRDVAVWDAFLRSFVAVDTCAMALEMRTLAVDPIGEKTRRRLMGELERRVEEFHDEQRRYLDAAKALAGRLLESMAQEDVIVPVVESPRKERVLAHSPVSRKLIDALRSADAIMAELETLRWNGLRKTSELEEERKRIVRSAADIGRWATGTVFRIESIRNMARPKKGDQVSAENADAGASGAG